MKYHILIFAALLVLSACNLDEGNKQKVGINSDTLAFTYDTIKYRAPDCGNKADSACSVALIIYPKFISQKVLNDTLAQKLMSAGFNSPEKKPDTSLQSFADNFIKGYVKDNPKQYSPEMFYTLNITADSVRQYPGLTTLRIDGYIYQGGAHGASSTTFVNWDTKNNRPVKLSDILINGYSEKLSVVGEAIFRKQEKLSDTSSLAHDYFFKDNRFALNENYHITQLGIRFLYNQYEIKPYAAGTTQLLIPYENIKSLLRPNTVITQFIK